MGYTRDVNEGSPSDRRHSGRPGASDSVWVAPGRSGSLRYGGAVVIVAASTAAAGMMYGRFELSDLTMVYLLGSFVTAVAFGRGPAILAAILSVAAFNFGFVPPRFTFQVEEPRYFVTFAVMLAVAVITGTLAARLREQLARSRGRERRSAALYRLSHELVSRSLTSDVLDVAVARIGELLDARVAVVQPVTTRLAVIAGDPAVVDDEAEEVAARHAFDTGLGAGLEHIGGRGVLHLPLEVGLRPHGVISVAPFGGTWDPERFHLLRVLASLTALALERCRLAEEAHSARLQADTERSRSALLSSVSHDLRTPLAAITGAATSLRDGSDRIDDLTRHELAQMIADEGQRLDRLIGNILDMTRLEAGMLRVRREWHSLEEVVGVALARLESILGARSVVVVLPPTLPLVSLDDVLFEQALANLIENAHKYSPEGSVIEVTAAIEGRQLRVEIADRGPGFAEGEEQRVFEKFFRGAHAAVFPGVGLGLTICRGILEAHGGSILAANREGGGARFTILLPLEGEPPTVEHEKTEAAVPRDSLS